MFDRIQGARRRIAVVGSGISGLACAYYLSPDHDVVLYEASDRLGGHARTVMAGKSGDQPVDTGFIVFNYVTYPNLTRLFDELNVPVTRSDMSFAASIDGGRIEYGLKDLRSITAQRRNLARPGYYKMVSDILRFAKHAEHAAKDDTRTVDALMADLRLGPWFRKHYLLPICGAIWSTPVEDVGHFPARSLVQFFANHGLLRPGSQHQWWTVKGGSIEYVRRLEAALLLRGVEIRRNASVTAIARRQTASTIYAGQDGGDDFDDVIFACHSDQTRAILGDGATGAERAALEAIRYQPNKAVLHCDTSHMPQRRACWSSWVYRSQDGAIGMTYWMNNLQNIPHADPLFVTLNPSFDIARDKIYDEVEFAHPVFDRGAINAQSRIRTLQGQNRTWFAGAWNRHGFHEDGIASALRVVRGINAADPMAGRMSAAAELPQLAPV